MSEKPKTTRQLAAMMRARRQKAKDPEYFAKLAAKRKGEVNPNMARSTEVSRKGGLKGGKNRGQGIANQQRVARSAQLQRQLQKEEKGEGEYNNPFDDPTITGEVWQKDGGSGGRSLEDDSEGDG